MTEDTTRLPEGTFTVLSTDLVDSTALNQRLGDVAVTTLEREIAELAQVQVEKHRGVVITQAGDGLMVAFQSARRAVAFRGVHASHRRPRVPLELRPHPERDHGGGRRLMGAPR